MLREKYELEELGAADATPRDIRSEDPILFSCRLCHSHGPKQYLQAQRTLRSRGYGYLCQQCHKAKISKGRSVEYSTEFLASHKLVDIAPRVITSSEVVSIRCHGCEATGDKKWTDAQKDFKRYGHTYQCKDCKGEKYTKRSLNETWIANQRAAALKRNKK
jgi:predicted SprT family Zn-dependent metalloprotease